MNLDFGRSVRNLMTCEPEPSEPFASIRNPKI